MTDSVEGVALLAVCYTAMFNYSSVGPRVDGSEIYEDLEVEHPTLSLVTMFASAAFDEFDWAIVRARGEDERRERRGLETELSRVLVEVDPYRVEAVLHALAAGGSWEGLPVPADLALPVMERWELVEAAMDRWRALGISATREDVEQLFIDASAEVSGRPRDEIYDEFLDAMEAVA